MQRLSAGRRPLPTRSHRACTRHHTARHLERHVASLVTPAGFVAARRRHTACLAAKQRAPTLYSKKKTPKPSQPASRKPEDYPLKVSAEETEGKYLTVTITVPQQRCQIVFDEVVEDARKNVEIPGRQSNAKATVDELAMQPYEDRALDSTIRILEGREELSEKFAARSDFTYRVRCELGSLEITFEKPYTGLKVDVAAVLNQSVEDYQVERALITRREHGGSMHLAQRPAQPGDTLIIDYNVAKKADGKMLTGMERQRVTVDTMDDSSFLPGIMHRLEGMEAEDTRHINYELPNLHISGPGTASKINEEATPVLVTVTLREVYEWRLPELTLAMCQKVSEEVESIDQYKEQCRQAIKNDASIELQSRLQGALMSALAEVTAIQNQPETPFQEFCQGRYEADLMRAVNSGIVQQDDLDRFLEESALNQYIEDRKEPLQGEFRALLAMDKIYEDEGLVANDDIVQAEYDQAMERASQLQEESAQESTEGIEHQAMEYAKNEAMNYAVLAFLEEQAEVTVKPLPDEDAPDLKFSKRSVFMA